MPTVGRALAAERIRQGLDLEAAAAVTKINTRTLKFIETDEFEQLPGMIFARNFVRQYAQFLKLDSAALVEQFDREQSVPEPELPNPQEQKRIHVPPMDRPPVFNSNIVSAFVTLVLTVVVCAAALYAFQYWRSHRPIVATNAPLTTKPFPAARPTTQRASPGVPNPVVARPAPTTPQAATPGTPPTSVALTSPQAANGSAAVHVVVTAKEACWARIIADGKVLFAGVLNPGETRTVSAATEVNLRAGNAAGLAVKLNGNDVPPLGPEGQVRTMSLTPTGAHVIAPNPEVSEPL